MTGDLNTKKVIQADTHAGNNRPSVSFSQITAGRGGSEFWFSDSPQTPFNTLLAGKVTLYEIDRNIEPGQQQLSPEGRLWLQILVDYFLMLREGWGSQEYAKLFIFEKGNIFFESLSEELGIEPDVFRERIRKALKRSKTASRRNATLEISETESNDKGKFNCEQ